MMISLQNSSTTHQLNRPPFNTPIADQSFSVVVIRCYRQSDPLTDTFASFKARLKTELLRQHTLPWTVRLYHSTFDSHATLSIYNVVLD